MLQRKAFVAPQNKECHPLRQVTTVSNCACKATRYRKECSHHTGKCFCLLSPAPNNKSLAQSHHTAVTSPGWLTWILRLLNLGNHQLEGSGDVLVQPCASLCESAFELVGQLTPVFLGYLSLLGFEVAFVADNNQWHPLRALFASMLVMPDAPHGWELDVLGDSESCPG